MSELAALLGAAVLYMVVAMWATQPPYTCATVYEPHRQLDLERDVDREHLAQDAAAIGRWRGIMRSTALRQAALSRNVKRRWRAT